MLRITQSVDRTCIEVVRNRREEATIDRRKSNEILESPYKQFIYTDVLHCRHVTAVNAVQCVSVLLLSLFVVAMMIFILIVSLGQPQHTPSRSEFGIVDEFNHVEFEVYTPCRA